MINQARKLAVIEGVSSFVVKPESLPGIDISPLIDALIQFLLQLLDDCPVNEIRKAAEQSAKRPVIRLFWRLRLRARLPDEIVRNLPDPASDLLSAGAAMTDAEWAALA